MGKIATTKAAIDGLCKRLLAKSAHVRAVYEVGPCGYPK